MSLRWSKKCSVSICSTGATDTLVKLVSDKYRNWYFICGEGRTQMQVLAVTIEGIVHLHHGPYTCRSHSFRSLPTCSAVIWSRSSVGECFAHSSFRLPALGTWDLLGIYYYSPLVSTQVKLARTSFFIAFFLFPSSNSLFASPHHAPSSSIRLLSLANFILNTHPT